MKSGMPDGMENTVVSPSPRRAWIEIKLYYHEPPFANSRPPHGGRGLKWRKNCTRKLPLLVALPTEGVD